MNSTTIPTRISHVVSPVPILRLETAIRNEEQQKGKIVEVLPDGSFTVHMNRGEHINARVDLDLSHSDGFSKIVPKDPKHIHYVMHLMRASGIPYQGRAKDESTIVTVGNHERYA